MRTDWTIHSFDTLVSTQDTAKSYLAEGRPLPFAVLAQTQTAGRGRGGNKWISPSGNLYTSLVMNVGHIPVRNAGQYSFLTAVALMATLAEYGITTARNKWPNDILVDGRKIAGILLESDCADNSTLNALIIGVGVNLAEAPDGAISVGDGMDTPPNPSAFLDRFIAQLIRQLDKMAAEGFAAIREDWLSKAYGLGTEIRVRLPAETFYGEFLGLDQDGALQVKVANEKSPRVIHSGDVFFEKKEA